MLNDKSRQMMTFVLRGCARDDERRVNCRRLCSPLPPTCDARVVPLIWGGYTFQDPQWLPEPWMVPNITYAVSFSSLYIEILIIKLNL